MKISIIVPFYNEISLIRHSTESIFINFNEVDSYEILICNDGDYSESDIRSNVSEQVNGVLCVLKNRFANGPGGARNTGLDASTGDIIAFLDADDIWLPGKILAQIHAVQGGATFITTGYRFDCSQNVVVPPARIVKPDDVFLCRGIGTSTVLITRELLGKTRFKDIRFAQDIDFWFALASKPNFRYSRVCKEFVQYSTRGTTKNKLVQLQYLYKVLGINDIGWMIRSRVLTSYILSGVYNHYIKRLFA